MNDILKELRILGIEVAIPLYLSTIEQAIESAAALQLNFPGLDDALTDDGTALAAIAGATERTFRQQGDLDGQIEAIEKRPRQLAQITQNLLWSRSLLRITDMATGTGIHGAN